MISIGSDLKNLLFLFRYLVMNKSWETSAAVKIWVMVCNDIYNITAIQNLYNNESLIYKDKHLDVLRKKTIASKYSILYKKTSS